MLSLDPLLSRRAFLTAAGGAVLVADAPKLARAADAVPPVVTIAPGFITVATNGDMPMASVSGDQFIGTDGEMLSRIAAKLNLKVRPMLMDWSSTVESVRSNRADCMLGDMAWTKTRAKVLAITDPLYFVSSRLLMKKGAITHGAGVKVEDLKGHTLGVLTGGVPIPDLKRLGTLADLKIYDTTDACLRDVIQGRIDCATLDAMATDYMISHNVDWGLEQIRIKADPAYPLLSGRWEAVVGVTPSSPSLFDALNAGVAWLWRTGQVKEILAKYGIADPDYVTPLDDNPRVGVDRSADGSVLGREAGKINPYAALFT